MEKWQYELQYNISSIDDIKRYIPLETKEEKKLKKITKKHPMSITRYYFELIDWNDPKDPIRKMAVPSLEELNISGSYDTSGEKENSKLVGLQHKYKQTVLLLATNVCAMYCRYCFRKRLVGIKTEEVLKIMDNAIDYIREHKEINNVLISGGDPFLLPTEIIENFLEKLDDIPHLDFIRFGTRTPVTFPDRILKDQSLCRTLKRYSYKDRRIYIVTQYNHPREITDKSKRAVDKLLNANMIINNQTVLLKDVNDDPETLAELQNKIVSIGVNPYYVFQCRPVKRVKHGFQVPLKRGYEIVEEAKGMLNGHSKRFKYIMSHRTGKIEIVGIIGEDIYLKYHQAKNPRNIGKFFKKKLTPDAGWFDDLK